MCSPWSNKTNQITEEMAPDLDAFWKAAEAAQPVKRAADPGEIANAIYFLASDEASFVTGASLIVDGGYLAK